MWRPTLDVARQSIDSLKSMGAFSAGGLSADVHIDLCRALTLHARRVVRALDLSSLCLSICINGVLRMVYCYCYPQPISSPSFSYQEALL